MGTLETVLAWKQKRDAESSADLQAIPGALMAFQAAKQTAHKSLIDDLTTKIAGAKNGYNVDTNTGTLTLNPSLQPEVTQYLIDPSTNSLTAIGSVPKGSKISQTPQAAQKIQTGTDENGNPIYESVAQGRYDVSSDKAEQNQWNALIKSNDPATASSRSTLGMASNANLRANRALTLLDSPTTTKQDLGLVIEDLGGIMMGGVPTDQAMSLTDYNTLVSKVQSAKQYLSGVPEGAIPPAIKEKLRASFNDLKKLDYDFINNHLNMQEAGQKKLIEKRPEDWKAFREKIMFDPYKQSKDSNKGLDLKKLRDLL